MKSFAHTKISPPLVECASCSQMVARVFGADGMCGDCLTRESEAMRRRVFHILFGARDDRNPSETYDDGRE